MNLLSPGARFRSAKRSFKTAALAGICQAEEPRYWLLFKARIHCVAVTNNIAPLLILGAVMVRDGEAGIVTLPVTPYAFVAAIFPSAAQVYLVLQSYTALPAAGPVV